MQKKKIIIYTTICVSLLLVLVFVIIKYNSTIKTNLDLENNIITHFIDVGQGDCILIQVNHKNLLIDSGPRDSAKKIIKYLKNNNITKLDYVIATHPHDDHIGGMASIIETFNVAEFIAPKVTSSTDSFEDMIGALISNNLKIKVAKPNMSLDLGPNTTCTILSPNKKIYKDTNNYSCAIKISYKKSSYLFTGDIDNLSEEEILSKDYNLKAQVLKIAHHGSSSSTSNEFLRAVLPKIAVISCGAYNSYGHPNKETTDKLQNLNCIIYRTDLDKNIVLISDGTNIEKQKN